MCLNVMLNLMMVVDVFKQDQKICQEWATLGERWFFDTVMFVSISIRVQTHVLEKLFLDYKQRGEYSSGIFGFKYETLYYMEQNSARLYQRYLLWLKKSRKSKRDKDIATLFWMEDALSIPGFNVAKAGFLVQLTMGTSWCADVNNIEWFGFDYNKFIVQHGRQHTKKARSKILAYLELGDRLGGTAKLWNNWCKQIHKKYPGTFPDAQNVSELHWRVHDQIPY